MTREGREDEERREEEGRESGLFVCGEKVCVESCEAQRGSAITRVLTHTHMTNYAKSRHNPC